MRRVSCRLVVRCGRERACHLCAWHLPRCYWRGIVERLCCVSDRLSMRERRTTALLSRRLCESGRPEQLHCVPGRTVSASKRNDSLHRVSCQQLVRHRIERPYDVSAGHVSGNAWCNLRERLHQLLCWRRVQERHAD